MLTIDSCFSVIIDGKDTGLKLTQRRKGTVVYTPESAASGKRYCEHKMPFLRYSTAHDEPHQAGKKYDPKICAGRCQLETDIRVLLNHLGI